MLECPAPRRYQVVATSRGYIHKMPLSDRGNTFRDREVGGATPVNILLSLASFFGEIPFQVRTIGKAEAPILATELPMVISFRAVQDPKS